MASESILGDRPVPPPLADERSTLEGWLEFHRATLVVKCIGLDDRQVRLASVEPSSLTLLGLVQHMAVVERNWFQQIFAGKEVRKIYEEGMGDGFTLVTRRGMDEASAVWRAEVATSRELIAGASLDDVGEVPQPEASIIGERVSLRWILQHMIEEYARHNGHADLLRERIDGVTGM